MNIILIGMRGSGKSTVGKLLAQKLKKQFIEIDDLIVAKAGKSIKDIVNDDGWGRLRQYESDIVAEIPNIVNDAVIATGGGVVIREINIGNLKKNDGIIVLLDCSIDTIIRRIGEDKNRPLLTDARNMKEDLQCVLVSRKQLYKQYADLVITSDSKDAHQVTDELVLMFRNIIVNSFNIDAITQLCCVIGHPVTQSLSPQIHNAGYKKLGLNYVFLAFDVIDVKTVISGFRAFGIRGISVTVPHKIEIMKYLDQIDPIAQKIGAVNTIVNKGGKLIGYNTDWIGAMIALEEKTPIAGKKVALLGAGGAARAIAYGLKKNRAIVSVFDRTISSAQKLVVEFDLKESFSLNQKAKIKGADIIINATSLGMAPNDKVSPISANCINSNQTIFDIVFKPRETLLLKQAREKNATIIYGSRMLLFQAMEQFKLFTGINAPRKEMEEVLNA